MAIKKKNPRYLVSLDGYDLATVPAFTKVEAVKRAKQIYPGRRGTWTAVQVEDEMYGRMRGGAETEARMRLERKRKKSAERTSKQKQNPAFKLATKERLMQIIMTQKLDVHPWPRGRYPYTVEWKFRDGSIFATEFPDKTALVDAKYLQQRNGTHIHAETVGHLDVAKVHNPFMDLDDEATYKFIVIPYVDGDDEIYPIETAAEIEDAQAAMAANGLKYAPVYLNDHGETVKTGLGLSVD